MKFLGFFIGYHDSNLTVSVDRRVYYAKSERLTGVKHHRADMDFIRKMCRRWGVERFDAIAFSDVGNYNNMGMAGIEETYRRIDLLCQDVPTYRVDHHYAHMLSSWPIVDLSTVEVGVAIDGEGDHGVRCRFIANPGSLAARMMYSTQNRSFGSLLKDIGDLMGLSGRKLDYAGKIMGLQAYGSVDLNYVNSIDLPDIGRRIKDLVYAIEWRGKIPAETPNFFSFHNSSFRDWIASVHYICEQYVLLLFSQFCRRDQSIVFAGGCAQNSVCNEHLFRHFPGLHVPPHCYDGGISLGCVEFLRMLYDQPQFSADGFPFWQTDEYLGYAAESTSSEVARLLTEGKIVGWLQGNGEVGPRALGHRSILMDPRIPQAKDILNERVKHRESWRPFAPSVLESHANEWFELEGRSPYMLRALPVREQCHSTVPAIVHEDRTSRIQTVGDDGSGVLSSYRSLIADFNRRTGVPMVLNTSFNAGGSPIYGSRAQCLEFFVRSDLDAICIGDELLVK